MIQELSLRNVQVSDIKLPSSNRNKSALYIENGELLKESDLSKNKVKLNLLDAMLAHSRKLVHPQDNNEIQKKMKQREEMELIRATSDPNTYFKALFQQLKETHPNMHDVTAKVEAVNQKISHQIAEGDVTIGKRIIPPRKEELNSISRSKFLNGSSPELFYQLSRNGRQMHRSVQDISMDKSEIKSEKIMDPRILLRKLKIESAQVRQLVDDRKKKEEERSKLMDLQEKEKKEEEKRQRHEELVKNIEEHRDVQKKRQEEMKKNQIDFNLFQKQYKEKKPLYVAMEENYKQKFEIEVQQEKLSKLRDLYKPHKIEDFVDHFKKYQEFKNSETERIAQKKNAFQSSLSIQNNPVLWRGRVHEFVEEEISNARLMSASEDRKNRQIRQKNYADMIKANHAPTIDEEKQKEVSSRTNELIMPKSIIKKLILKQEITQEPNPYKIGQDYMEFAKKQLREQKKFEDEQQFAKYQVEGSKPSQQMSAESQVRSSAPKLPYKNYMREEKVKNQLKKEDPKREWENQLNKFSGAERVEKVLQAAQQLDLQASRKEKMLRNCKQTRPDDIEYLDDCYFNSIKAKIALLKGANEI